MRAIALRILGLTSLGLGIAGIFLPLLPTTVFVLIAAWAFSRSSPRMHHWLLDHPKLGPPIRSWNAHHAMPGRAKAIALTTLLVSYSFTAWIFGPLSLAAIISGICIAAVGIYIAHIPVLTREQYQSLS